MQTFHAATTSALAAAADAGVAPCWFLWVTARDRSTGDSAPLGLWSGDEPITLTVPTAAGSNVSRSYSGEAGLSVDAIALSAGLEDRPLTVVLSQIADGAQALVRTLDARHAYCEVHFGLWSGGALVGPPQLVFVGVVDEAPITTPAAGGDGAITLSIRDEMMTQLAAINPARSSDAHQRRRNADDAFSRYSGVIGARDLQWGRS